MMDEIVPVLLAGGLGTRLWPLSRKSYPKQFLKINHVFSNVDGTDGTTTKEYQCRDLIYGANGYIETYYNDDGYCFDSLVEIPGM